MVVIAVLLNVKKKKKHTNCRARLVPVLTSVAKCHPKCSYVSECLTALKKKHATMCEKCVHVCNHTTRLDCINRQKINAMKTYGILMHGLMGQNNIV